MPNKPIDHSLMKKPRRWLRWLRHLFVTVHFLLYAAVLLASAALYIAFRHDGLEIVNTYFLEPMGVRYAKAEGSLAGGFTLHKVQSDTIFAEKLTLDYNLSAIIQGEHIVDKIALEGVRIDLADFKNGGDSPWPFPTFKLKEVKITNLQLISAYPIELDIRGENGTYDGDALNLKAVQATLKSRYASAAIQGSIQNNSLAGNALLYPDHRELAPYSGRFTDLPRSVALQIRELSVTQALISGAIDRLSLKQDPSLHADTVALDLDYRYENDYLDVNAAYLLSREGESMQTKQHLRYTFGGKTTTEFDGIVASTRPLPSNQLHGEISDNAEGLSGRLSINGGTLLFSSNDYDRYRWDIGTRHENLAFLPALPVRLQSSPFTLAARGEYTLSKNFLSGSGRFKHNHALFEGVFALDDTRRTLEGNLTLPPDAPTWKEWSHKPLEKLNLSLSQEHNVTSLLLNGDSLELSVKADGKKIDGSGSYAGSELTLKGSLAGEHYDLWIDTHIPSVFATASKLYPITLHRGEFYDAEIHAQTHLSLGTALKFHTDLQIPWYAVILDSQRAFGGTKGSASFEYNDGNITLERYRLEIADHPLTTDKTSRMHLSENGDLIIDQFHLYDTLVLKGHVSPDTSASLRLHSERFSYEGPEGEAHARADITFTRDRDANQELSGDLTFLDAKITYLPLQQFKVMDDDIVIIQDVRPPSAIKFAMNLRITARRPIQYLTKELDLRLNPDFTLWKDPLGPLQVLGMVTVPSGTATTAGKQFEVQHSEIYFGGDVPLNPYLNLTVGHEVDYKKILIYITHRLDSPIFLFSSDPIMSQNDIMSYILFGTPANTLTTGDTSTTTIRADATNFMLGAGIKGLIHGVTKLQIDTMNILTTQQGGMGFEVGARLNKNFRVLYKNDILSSVLLQYSVNRWLRLDIDVHELGQGINAVYIKDFEDFLPHNEPKKK